MLNELVKRIQGLATDTRNMHVDHPHVRDRMSERGVSMRQVLEVLRKGNGIDGPTLDEYGDYRIKLNSPLKKASLTGFHATAKHIAAKAVSPSSETMRTI